MAWLAAIFELPEGCGHKRRRYPLWRDMAIPNMVTWPLTPGNPTWCHVFGTEEKRRVARGLRRRCSHGRR